LGVVAHGAVAGLQSCAGGVRFCGAVVASVAGMGATGDLQPDPVPAQERVRDGRKIKLNRMRSVCRSIGETHDPVREVDRPAARRDVTEAGMQVDVRQRCLHVKADPHRADHLEIDGLRVAGEGKNIRSGFEAALSAGPADKPTAVPAMDGVGFAGS
jgi:hypothetical protein